MNNGGYGTVGRLQQLTHEYASYSRSRSGLGTALGGCVGIVVFLAIWLFGGTPFTAGLAIGLTALWLVGKAVFRHRYYQQFGEARELWVGAARQAHLLSVLILTPLLLGFAVWIVVAGWLSRPAVAVPYLIFCLATPWIVWRALFTVNEIMVGAGLLFLCAVTASGHTPSLLGLLFIPAYAVAMIATGLAEHRQFELLAARLAGRGAR